MVREPSETAKLAQQAIENHKSECERRYDMVLRQLERLDGELSHGLEALHTRINTIDQKFTNRWWSMLLSVIAFLALVVFSLIGYIYVSEFRRISVQFEPPVRQYQVPVPQPKKEEKRE